LRAVPDQSVETLRSQLRDRGYLSHGIERWFALDPWRSRTFWVELMIVAAKAAALVAAFGALATTAVVVIRNYPLTVVEIVALFALYAAGWAAVTFALVVAIGLLIKIRPELAVETPRSLLGISIAAAALLLALLAVWWYGFPGAALPVEIAAVVGLAGLLFVVATIVISAALLSFSIHELQRIPTIHQKPRTIPIAVAAVALAGGLLGLAYATPAADANPPAQIVTSPVAVKLALVAVDGLTEEIVRSRADIASQFRVVTPAAPVGGGSASERWASIGTGVPTQLHRVRAIAGVRLAGGRHVLQSVSNHDALLLKVAPAIGVAVPQPLPPTVRKRDFVWESLARRGVPSIAVNWWTAEDSQNGALTSIAQESVFANAQSDPVRIDEIASARLLSGMDKTDPQFATVYLPGLDVILNRQRSGLASSLRVLDNVGKTITALRQRGYEVVLAGQAGEGQSGRGVVASTIALANPRSLMDVAPTVLETMGFPASTEMSGIALAGTEHPARIVSYGSRVGGESATRLTQEYYESLRSLGYIR
jgi:hypothetical protein